MTNTKHYNVEQLKRFTKKGIFFANNSLYKISNIEKINGLQNHRSYYIAEFKACNGRGRGKILSDSCIKFEIRTNYKLRFFPGFSEPITILEASDTNSFVNGEDKSPYDSFYVRASNCHGPEYRFLEKTVEEFFTNNAKIQQNETNIARKINLQYPLTFSQHKKSLYQPSVS